MRYDVVLMGYVGLVAVMSVVTLAVFAWDKRRAKNQGWRVSEKTLHTLELLGGWPGAWLGMRWLRHKSVKKSYRLVFGLIVALHAVGVGLIMWLWVR
ncbi:MAG: DUF1294 domain-containing protein [Planctomycetota bacterium]